MFHDDAILEIQNFPKLKPASTNRGVGLFSFFNRDESLNLGPEIFDKILRRGLPCRIFANVGLAKSTLACQNVGRSKF